MFHFFSPDRSGVDHDFLFIAKQKFTGMSRHIPVDPSIHQRIIAFLTADLHPHSEIVLYHVIAQIERIFAGRRPVFFHYRIAGSHGVEIVSAKTSPFSAQKTKRFVHPFPFELSADQINGRKRRVFKHFLQIFMQKRIPEDPPLFVPASFSCFVVQIQPETFFRLCKHWFCLSLQPEMPCRDAVSFVFQ